MSFWISMIRFCCSCQLDLGAWKRREHCKFGFYLHIWLEEMGLYEAQGFIVKKDTLHVWNL
jgi:hypothetical protein